MLISCSNCGSKIRVPDSAAGKKGKCPKCGTVITIPLEEPPAEAAIVEPAPVEEAPPAPVAEQPAGSPFDFSEPEPPPPPRRTSRKADDEEDEVLDEPAEVEEEEEERRTRRPRKAPESIGLSVTSLVLGIVSLLTAGGGFCCCLVAPVSLLCAIGALITGFLGMNKGGKVMAIVGMSLGGLSLLLALAGIVLGFVLGGLQAIMGAAGRH